MMKQKKIVDISIVWSTLQLLTIAMCWGVGAVASRANERPPASGVTEKPIPGVVRPACLGQAQIPLNRCATRWYQLTQQLHDETLDDWMTVASAEETEQLYQADTAWQAFRDSHCELLSSQVEGGSLYPLVYNSCLARLTNERVAALHRWGMVDLSLDEAERQLEDAFVTLDAQMNPIHLPSGPQPSLSQRLWENYRDHHCRFESIAQYGAFQQEPEPDLDGCYTRLTLERIVHLERLAELGW